MPRTKTPNRVQLWRANLAEICLERAEHLRLVLVMRAAKHGPKPLLAEITAFSPDQQDEFGFNMYESDKPWYWQSEFVDDIMSHNALLVLKARQLGATWVAAAIALWYMLFRPGSYCLLFSFTQEEAKEVIARVWTMYQSLPPYLRSHVTVVTPERSDEPSEWIRVRHRNGRISRIRALPATQKHGRSANATYIVMDEAAYQDYCKQIYTASNGAISRGGKLVIISTANGVGNPDTEEGNFFYILYHTRDVRKLYFVFLPWNLHPERDEEWYENVAMRLPEQERNQEYPLNPRDAFILSGALFFDRDALFYYASHTIEPKYVGQFFQVSITQAQFLTTSDGAISVFQLPREDTEYCISNDTATGRGQDFSAAHVCDMETGQVVAEMWGKMDAPRWAEQLYFLGRWYNDALIGVELGGGYGDAVIIALRDGGSGRRPYKNLYTHRVMTKKGKPRSERYGFPITEGSRKTILDGLQYALMQRQFVGLSLSTLDELNAFVYATTNPSPRAQEGMHDDRVLSLALMQEMYRQKGNRPSADKQKKAMRKVNQREYSPPAVKAGA
jgi:hypothetical protein